MCSIIKVSGQKAFYKDLSGTFMCSIQGASGLSVGFKIFYIFDLSSFGSKRPSICSI